MKLNENQSALRIEEVNGNRVSITVITGIMYTQGAECEAIANELINDKDLRKELMKTMGKEGDLNISSPVEYCRYSTELIQNESTQSVVIIEDSDENISIMGAGCEGTFAYELCRAIYNKLVDDEEYRTKIYQIVEENKHVFFDSSWLITHIEENDTEYRWLIKPLKDITKCYIKSPFYTYFVSSENANQEGAEWQFDKNIILVDTIEGDVVLDVLKSGKIGGIEYLSKLYSSEDL